MGYLRATHSLRIQRHRIIASISRIDKLGQGMRQLVGRKKNRQNYTVPRPNALWHIDGHHKLIAWGIVVHGVADGYTRKVRAEYSCAARIKQQFFFCWSLNRSLDFVRVQIIGQKLFSTCLWMQ